MNSDLTCQGAGLATQIGTFFRMMATPVALKYGGGESGLARFLKDAGARLEADPKALFDPEEREFVDNILAGAWRTTDGRSGGDPQGDIKVVGNHACIADRATGLQVFVVATQVSVTRLRAAY